MFVQFLLMICFGKIIRRVGQLCCTYQSRSSRDVVTAVNTIVSQHGDNGLKRSSSGDKPSAESQQQKKLMALSRQAHASRQDKHTDYRARTVGRRVLKKTVADEMERVKGEIIEGRKN